MALISYSVHHEEHGLSFVERAAGNTRGLPQQLVKLPHVVGAMMLSTCNRVEILIDVVTDTPGESKFYASLITTQLSTGIFPPIAVTPGPCPVRGTENYEQQASTVNVLQNFEKDMPCPATSGHFSDSSMPARLQEDVPHSVLSEEVVPLRIRHGAEVLHHIFRIAAGLDSMVVGEREISGQLRRALQVAHNQETASPTITRVCEHALHTSRRVAQLTGLASQGRSVVNIGLQTVSEARYLDEHTSTLIIGTGSYAGATVAALRARGIQKIQVYSQSGRAVHFAQGHDLEPVDDLIKALDENELIVTCSGQGDYIITRDILQESRSHRSSDIVLLDLALSRDVDMAVSELPGVYVINLDVIQSRVPQAQVAQVKRAHEIVDEGVAEAIQTIRSRRMDPVVVAMREKVNAIVEDEIARLPNTEQFNREDIERSLKRMAARFAHTPSKKAREAGQMGRANEFVDAVEQVFGLDIDPESLGEGTKTKRTIGCPGSTALTQGEMNQVDPVRKARIQSALSENSVKEDTGAQKFSDGDTEAAIADIPHSVESPQYPKKQEAV